MPASETPRALKSARSLTLAAYASFVPIGIVNVILGPMLPTLSARWSLNYSQAGALFTAQYLASTVAVALSGVLVSRWGFRFAMKAGLLVTAAAVALLLVGPKLMGIICIAAIGAGIGLAVPAANLVVAEVNPARRSAALSVLNFCWSVGAVSSPFLVAAAAKSSRLPLMFGAVAGVMILVVGGIAVMPASTVEPTTPGEVRGTRLPGHFLGIDWRHRALLSLGVLFFVYVGTENGFGGWIASYSKSLGSMSPAMSTMTPSFFYAALMFGRWIAPLLLRTVNEVRLAQAGLLLACGGMLALVLSHGMGAVMTSATLAGLGLSSVYPITISLLSREFGATASRVGSLMFTLANLGGGSVPWLVGISSTRFGTLKAGLLLPLVGTALMFGLYLRDWKAIESCAEV
jgi:MFS transporter, FHS family, glucose/mannose:H+ symporter